MLSWYMSALSEGRYSLLHPFGLLLIGAPCRERQMKDVQQTTTLALSARLASVRGSPATPWPRIVGHTQALLPSHLDGTLTYANMLCMFG
eukprot:4929423-Amphidinium_carterae.1